MFTGLVLFALSWNLFLIPAEITGGGIAGVGALVFYSTGLQMGITYFAINAVLVIVALKVLGASFGAKTLINMAIMSLLLTLFQPLSKNVIIDDTFLSSILGGIFAGIGLGLVFSQGGSTGGTDIIAMIVNKYRRISPGRVILYCDVLIISSSWFIFKSPEKLVYGYVMMWVVSYTVDSFLNGNRESAQLFIFTEKWKEIKTCIIESDRGVTVIDGTGGYSDKPVKIVMTVVRKRESSAIFKQIKRIDPDAFVSMGKVMGVFGKGFDQLKA